MEKDFKFHEWAALAQASPEAFEQQRKATIGAFLDAATADQRQLGLRLQREIDYEIRRAGDPQQALSAIAKMMWGQVDFLCEELEALSGSMRELEATATAGAARLALALQSAAPVADSPRSG